MACSFIEELCNKEKFSAIDELLTENFRVKLLTQPSLSGKEALCGFVSYVRNAGSALAMTIDWEVASDNEVAFGWKFSGQQVGQLNGVPPSGNQVEEYGTDLFKFWSGNITEFWDIWDRPV
jgi:predicted ester cyclase